MTTHDAEATEELEELHDTLAMYLADRAVTLTDEGLDDVTHACHEAILRAVTNAPEPLPVWPELVSAAAVEAHLLDLHGQDVSGMPREARTWMAVRRLHAEAHRDGRERFPHHHDPMDLPVLTELPLDAGMLGR